MMRLNTPVGNLLCQANLNHADFLFYNLLGRFEEFQSLRQGAAIPGIRKEHVQEVGLPLPNRNIQKSIVAYLDSICDEIEAMHKIQIQDEQSLEQVEQAILAQAFWGEL